MSQSKTGHIVAATMLAWGKPCVFKELLDEVLILYWHCITITTLCTAGHTKSATSLLCKLVRLKNIYATFIVAIPLYDKVLKEISRQFLPGQEDDLKAMIRWATSNKSLESIAQVCFPYVSVVAIECDPLPQYMTILQQNIVKTCEKLIQGESVEEQPGSGTVLEKILPPTLILIDVRSLEIQSFITMPDSVQFFLYEAFLGLRKLTSGSIPLYVFQSGAVSAIIFLFGPESLGGNGDLMEKMKPIMDLPEKEKHIEAEKVCSETSRMPFITWVTDSTM